MIYAHLRDNGKIYESDTSAHGNVGFSSIERSKYNSTVSSFGDLPKNRVSYGTEIDDPISYSADKVRPVLQASEVRSVRMDLRQYLKLDPTAAKRIASYIRTTEDAIWEISMGYRKPSERTCWRIEGATHGAVLAKDLRPDLESIKESFWEPEKDFGGSQS
jgi:hypothetical protein